MIFVIEFRSGTYFVNDEAERGGTLAQAMRFETKDGAEAYMRKPEREWMLWNGGMVVDARMVRP